MPKTVNLYEAKTHLSDLVERAARGEAVTLVTRDPQVRSYPGVTFLPA